MTKETVHKFLDLEVKDLNDKTGEVVFKFMSPTKDMDKDTILKSAYTRTLEANRPNIYHNRDHKDAVGTPKSFDSSGDGIMCVSQLAVKTMAGGDCYEQYKAGLIRGHSQEFVTEKSEPDPTGGRIIKEVRLWGVTSVTNIPANLDTPTMSVKSWTDISMQLKNINDFLHNGHISDECGEKFQAEYDRLYAWVSKNHTHLTMAGITNCENCKMVIDKENATGKCPNCGRYHAIKSHNIFTHDLGDRLSKMMK